MNNYDRLISRLDAFIRKYYANRLVRGSLVLLTCLLFYILTVSIGEYFLYMPVWLRLSVVSLFVVLGIAALVVWVIIPLAKMSKLGKVISHEQAAVIIGKHFPEVSDKLLNILQLKAHTDNKESHELIEASINQKAAQIAIVPITSAIDIAKNKKYLPFLLPLVLAGVFILVAAPNVFRDASERLLQPTKTFEKPAPFKFIIKTLPLQTVRNADYTLQVVTEGSALPADMSVELNGDRLLMQSPAKNTFQYTFRNVTDAVQFRLYAAGFYSQPYTLKVVQQPVLKAFKVHVDYPDYTGRKDEEMNSLGDMTVPVGTKVNWAFVAEHTDEALMRLGEGPAVKLQGQANVYASQYRFMNDTGYTLILRNRESNVSDSLHYNVQVIADQYPVIQLQEVKDTVSGKQVLLTGTAGDDYGINKVFFHFTVTDAQNKELLKKAIPLSITPGSLTVFQHYFDVDVLKLQPGQKLTYYIEAWDNDGVHGSKASRSEVMSYAMYDMKQLDSAINANAEQINSGLSNSAEHTEQLQDEYKDLQSRMLQSNSTEWEQQQTLQQLMNKQLQLKNQLENVKKRLEEQKQQSEQKQYSQDLKDKQDELQKQMDNLLNKELQEQMKKLQDLMKRLNKENALQTMKQLEQDNKLFNMDMQRMQELMKQLEMQMRLEDMANKMDDLAKKQEELKKETDNGKADSKELAKKQDDLKKELEKAMKEDMKDLKDANKESEQPKDLNSEEKDAKEAGENMQDSKQELDQKQNSNSSKSQSKAIQNLQSMSSSMRAAAGGMGMEELDGNIKSVRQTLTNLIRLSFDQEQLMKKVPQTPIATQSYIANQQEQSRLHQNSKMIRDSLFAFSKKSFKLRATVNKETTELERNMGLAASALEDRRTTDAVTRQQYVMTHTNNLALMLNEVLNNLLQQKNMGMQPSPNQGSCNNPGGMTPKPGIGKQLSDVITKQQQLGNMMQQMQSKMKNGNQNGSQDGQNGKEQNKPGEKEGQSEYGNSEQLARMAQQQAAIRRQLQQLNSLLNSKGMGNAKELKEIQEQMDRTETDLVNKRLGTELIQRQREILTRLLQAEKSLREQEQDDKRSSKTAEEISRPLPPELQKYLQDNKQLLEQYKTVPPQLKPYYKQMVEQYYKSIGSK